MKSHLDQFLSGASQKQYRKFVEFHLRRTSVPNLQKAVLSEIDRLPPQVRPFVMDYIDATNLQLGYDQEFWNRVKEYARGDAHVNTAESYFSLLKRGVMGAFHHVSRKHLNRYSDEFAFRWNRRHDSDAKRAEDAIRGADGKRLLYRGSPSLMIRVLIPWPTTV